VVDCCWHDYRARYYNPQIGRFIAEDPLEFRGGDANLYAYVWNSPLNFIDPFGWWGVGVQGDDSAGAGLSGGEVGTVGGGTGVFGGNGLNAGAYGIAGAFAGLGPYGPRYPDPPGSRNGDTGYVWAIVLMPARASLGPMQRVSVTSKAHSKPSLSAVACCSGESCR